MRWGKKRLMPIYQQFFQRVIAAILGHEFAHIANGDTLCITLALQSNVLVYVVRSLLMLIIKISAIIFGFFMTIVSDTEQGAKNIFIIIEACGRGAAWITDKFISFIVGVGVIIAQISRRKHELEADIFSADLGYSQPMLHLFERFEEIDGGKRNFLALNTCYMERILAWRKELKI